MRLVIAVSWGKAMSDVHTAVLVVEDEMLVRMDIVDELISAGFEVLEAGDADEAIAVLNDNPRIRAIFTDIDMPGRMDGLKLAALVRDRWPPVKIIVTSGHRQVGEGMLPDAGRFIPKPYNPGVVIASIREMVAAG